MRYHWRILLACLCFTLFIILERAHGAKHLALAAVPAPSSAPLWHRRVLTFSALVNCSYFETRSYIAQADHKLKVAKDSEFLPSLCSQCHGVGFVWLFVWGGVGCTVGVAMARTHGLLLARWGAVHWATLPVSWLVLWHGDAVCKSSFGVFPCLS